MCAAVLASGCGSLGQAPATNDALPTRGLTDAASFSAATGTTASPQVTPADLRWWRRFDDPALADWVERALAGNLDIAIAAERVQQARALLDGARAQRGFTLGAQVGADVRLRRDSGERRVQPGAALTLDFDTDLWGGLRQAERSAAAGVLGSQDLAQAARLSAAGLAARAYLEWREALLDHRLLGEALDLQREALRVVAIRVEAGISPVLDRDRAQAELAATEAEQAEAAVRMGQAQAALEVLAGERPAPGPLRVSAAMAPADAQRKLPVLRGEQPVVRPLDLLRLRPDLRAAEQALIAAAADIGVAEAALRPRLSLPGSVVFGAAMGSGAVFELVSATLSAVLDVTLLDNGARAANVAGAQSVAREASLVYRRTLLQALQQVESALVAQQGAQVRIAARERASAAALAAEAQSQILYRAGLAGFLDVVDAQRTARTNQRALLESQGDAAAAAVLVFETMGLIDPASPLKTDD